METLSGRDLANLQKFLQEAAVPGDLSTFATRLLPVINSLVPGDVVCFAQVDPVKEKVVTQITYASGTEAPGDKATFERHMMSHPVFQHWGATGQSAAARTSDFVSPSEWHEYGLYQEYYRHWRCEDSLAIGLPAPAGLVACFCIERGTSFTDRELALMETVRPHLANLYRNVEAFSLISHAGNGEGSNWILLDAHGHPVYASQAAWALIGAYFTDTQRREDVFPERLAAWVQRHLHRFDSGDEVPPIDTPLVHTRPDGSTLTIRMLWGPTTGQQAVLLLHETLATANDDRRPDPGLTEREQEVLAHAREGLTAGEIADLLCISRRTVEKHLEHIYNKLGVFNRVAAVTRMFLS